MHQLERRHEGSASRAKINLCLNDCDFNPVAAKLIIWQLQVKVADSLASGLGSSYRSLWALAGLNLATKDFANQLQREQVGIDHREHAVLVHRAQYVTAQFAQLGFVNHLEAAIDERLIGAVLLDGDFAVHQQALLFQFLDKRLGALTGFLEVAAEVEQRLGGVGRVFAVEQGIALRTAAFVAACKRVLQARAQRCLYP